MKRPVSAALALLLAVPASTWAAGQASGRAVLEQFSIQLVDLDLFDGISPSLSFALPTPGGSAGAATVFYSWYDVGETRSSSFQQAGDPWLPQQAAIVSPYGTARTSLAGGSTLGTSRLLASGGTQAPPDTVNCSIYYCSLPIGGFSAWLNAPLTGAPNFELSANTAMVISALGSVSAVAVDGGTLVYGEDPTVSYPFASHAESLVSLTVSGGSPTGGAGSQRVTDELSASARSVYDAGSGSWIDQTTRRNDRLAVSFLNLTDSAMQGVLLANVSATGEAFNNAFPLLDTSVSPVPEPATSALWLAGIGSLVAWRRRRTSA
jgi:MYXO-CTERM domain-containing protein